MVKEILFSDRNPIISSFTVTFLFLFAIFTAGAVSDIIGLSSKITFFIAYSVVALILAIFTNKNKNWHYYGFNPIGRIKRGDKRLFIPLFIIALLPLIAGFSTDLKSEDIIYLIVYMAFVAFVEETLFRGAILRTLQKKSDRLAIWGSCLLFAIPHIMNTLTGKDLVQTIIQVLFAFVIGLILAMLVIKTNNIILLIAYHFTSNTVSSITSSNVGKSFTLFLTSGIFIIGFIYVIYLYQLIKHKSSKLEMKGSSHTTFKNDR